MNIRGSNLNHFWGFLALAGECQFQRSEKTQPGLRMLAGGLADILQYRRIFGQFLMSR
jgi:hypothetical protein